MSTPENPEADVRGTLELILTEQVNRLLSSGTISSKQVENILIELEKLKLLPEQVEFDLSQELKQICTYKYDDAIVSSNRLGGFGWSLSHMQEHMERLLKFKMQQISTVFRTKGITSKRDDPMKTIQETLTKSLA